MMNDESSSSHPDISKAGKRLTSLINAASAFGNLHEEESNDSGNPTPLASQKKKKQQPLYYSNGAKGLAAASQHQQTLLGGRKQEISKHSAENKAQAHATQEDTHKKMKLVMSNPQLWLQFKSRLAVSDHGGGAVGVQAVLQEFLADHPEVTEQLHQSDAAAAAVASKNTKSRRISILETVSNFTHDLSNEASIRGNMTPPKFSLDMRKMHQDENERLQRAGSNRSIGSAGSNSEASSSKGGFMNSASELGINFLKRASAAATSSLVNSSSSFDSEACSSLQAPSPTGTKTVDYAQPLGSRGGKTGGKAVRLSNKSKRHDMMVAFNEQEEDGYVSTDGDDDDPMDALANKFDDLDTSQHNPVARGA